MVVGILFGIIAQLTNFPEFVSVADIAQEGSTDAVRINVVGRVGQDRVLRSCPQTTPLHQLEILEKAGFVVLERTPTGLEVRDPKPQNVGGASARGKFDPRFLAPGERAVLSSLASPTQVRATEDTMTCFPRGPYGLQKFAYDRNEGAWNPIWHAADPLNLSRSSEERIPLSEELKQWLRELRARAGFGRPEMPLDTPLLTEAPSVRVLPQFLNSWAHGSPYMFLVKDAVLESCIATLLSGSIDSARSADLMNVMHGLKALPIDGVVTWIYEHPGVASSRSPAWINDVEAYSPDALASLTLDRAADVAAQLPRGLEGLLQIILKCNDGKGVSALRSSGIDALRLWASLGPDARRSARQNGVLSINAKSGSLHDLVSEVAFSKMMLPGRVSPPKSWDLPQGCVEPTLIFPSGIGQEVALTFRIRKTPIVVAKLPGKFYEALTVSDLGMDLRRQMKKNPGGENIKPSASQLAATSLERVEIKITVDSRWDATFVALDSVFAAKLQFGDYSSLPEAIRSEALRIAMKKRN